MFTETELCDIDIALGKDLNDCKSILAKANTQFVSHIMTSKINRILALRGKTKQLIPPNYYEINDDM